MKNTTKFTTISAIAVAMTASSVAQTIYLNDQFATGTRTTQDLPDRAAWWLAPTASTTSSIVDGKLVTTKNAASAASTQLNAYFTSPGTYVSIADGGTLTLSLSYSFTSATTGADAIRIGLFDSNGSRYTQDQSVPAGSFSLPEYEPWRGYALYMPAGGTTANATLRERISDSTTIMTTSSAVMTGRSSQSVTGGTIISGDTYEFEMTLTRNGTELTVTSSLGGGPPLSFTDTSPASFDYDSITIFSSSALGNNYSFTIDNVEVQAVAPSWVWNNAASNFSWATGVTNWTANGNATNWVNGSGADFGATGAGAITVSGTNTVTSLSVSADGYSFTGGTLALGSAETAFAISNATTVASTIVGSNALLKTGNSTLTLSGNNTYSGATTVAGGTLRIDGNSRLGNTTNTITLSNAGVLEVTAAGTLTNDISVGAGHGVLSNSSSGALVIAGAVSKDGTVFTSRSGSGTNVFTGVISGASANSDFVVDGGTTVFSNAMTYNGPTIVINGGTLNIGTNNAIPTGSALRLGTNDTAGTVNLQGYNQTVGSLATAGTAGTNNLVTLDGGTLTISGGDSTTYAGAISGNGTVEKSGAGTLTLSGSVTATNLRISGGAVALGADDVLGSSLNLDLNGGTFIVGSAGTRYTDSLGTLTLSASSTIDMGATGGLGAITFADSSGITWATDAVLTITNWQGVAQAQSEVTKLIFGTGGLSSTQLGQIYFANQDISGGMLLGGQGELAPIPEARIIWAALALTLFILWRERRRLRRLLGEK